LAAELARREWRDKQLTEKAGISRATLSAIKGGKTITLNTAQKVAEAIAPLPVWIRKAREKGGKGEKSSGHNMGIMKFLSTGEWTGGVIPDGERDDTLTRIAGYYRGLSFWSRGRSNLTSQK
jgi:transcriptional regulator with XRE-family HTH domain